MTYSPVHDLRANAFVGAWERIELAQKLKVDPKGRAVEQLPELYWATMAEAAVLADLARASSRTGEIAGEYVVDRQRRIEESRTRFNDAIKRKQSRPKVSLWCRVLVTRGDWAGRFGQVTKMYPTNNVPPMIDVELDPPRKDPTEPITITVLHDDVEVGTPPTHDCEYDDPRMCEWPGHRG